MSADAELAGEFVGITAAKLLSLADRPKATGSLTVSSQSNLSPASHPCTDKPENLAEVILNR